MNIHEVVALTSTGVYITLSSGTLALQETWTVCSYQESGFLPLKDNVDEDRSGRRFEPCIQDMYTMHANRFCTAQLNVCVVLLLKNNDIICKLFYC